MRLSIATTITRPEERGDAYKEALACYRELADEVVVIDGSCSSDLGAFDGKQRTEYYEWPKEFDFGFISEQFQRSYEACTGDWLVRLDIDCLIHEKDFAKLRKILEENQDKPAMSFYKYQFILPDRYNLKSRLVLAANKKVFGDKLRFNSGGDKCQLSIDNKQIMPDDVPETGIPIWNYEKLLKTKDQIAEDQGRMERAYYRHFGKYQMGSDGTDESAFDKWVQAQQGKFAKPQKHIPLSDHPKFIQETIRNLNPKQWGYNGLNYLEKNDYI